MTTFYLIRHAEKDASEQLLAGRTPGIGLSARGRRQARAIARRLSPEAIRHVCSSPMQRAQETAEPLADERALDVQVSPAFDEIDFGDWTGMRFSDLEPHARWRQFNRFRSGTHVPGGESVVEVQARFVAGMLRLRDAFPDDGVAIVSHGDPLRVAIAYFLGAPPDLFERIEISVGSVSVLTLDDHGARLVRLNQVPEEDEDE